MALEKRGFTVMTLSECDNLLAAVGEFKPDLIFIDHNMPHICGTDAIKLLKATAISKHIPVILISASENVAQLAKECGETDHHVKPVPINNFVNFAVRYIS